MSEDAHDRVESATWNYDVNRFPQAWFTLQELSEGTVFVRDRLSPLTDLIRNWYKKEVDIEFLNSGTAVNDLGGAHYQRYKIRSGGIVVRECIGIRMFFDMPDPYDVLIGYGAGPDILGTKAIHGQYCLASQAAVDAGIINSVLQGLGVKGYAVQTKPMLPAWKKPSIGDVDAVPAPDFSPAETVTRPGPPESRAELVIRVKEELVALGYNPGPIDSVVRAETRAAIRAFSADNGLGSRNEVSYGLYVDLQVVGAQISAGVPRQKE